MSVVVSTLSGSAGSSSPKRFALTTVTTDTTTMLATIAHLIAGFADATDASNRLVLSFLGDAGGCEQQWGVVSITTTAVVLKKAPGVTALGFGIMNVTATQAHSLIS